MGLGRSSSSSSSSSANATERARSRRNTSGKSLPVVAEGVAYLQGMGASSFRRVSGVTPFQMPVASLRRGVGAGAEALGAGVGAGGGLERSDGG